MRIEMEIGDNLFIPGPRRMPTLIKPNLCLGCNQKPIESGLYCKDHSDKSKSRPSDLNTAIRAGVLTLGLILIAFSLVGIAYVFGVRINQ